MDKPLLSLNEISRKRTKSLLKIRVSAVRSRPWAPLFPKHQLSCRDVFHPWDSYTYSLSSS